MRLRSNPASRSADRPAFSLVELLVVIGIAGVLIGLLMPALSRTREQARRVMCLSNLRQAHIAFYQYAMLHRDQVVIGWRFIPSSPCKQNNNLVYAAPTQAYVLFGRLYVAGLMGDGQAYYCPSETDPNLMWNSSTNPWPPGPDGNPARDTKAGYAMNSELQIQDDLAGPSGYHLPKLTNFKSRAIIADLIATESDVRRRHKDGVNVLYGDGAAMWMPRSAFVFTSAGGITDVLAIAQSIAVQNNSVMDSIWSTMDQRR